MRIIKQGTKMQTVFFGTCRDCKTEFECDKNEVRQESGEYNSTAYVGDCPTCGKFVLMIMKSVPA